MHGMYSVIGEGGKTSLWNNPILVPENINHSSSKDETTSEEKESEILIQ